MKKKIIRRQLTVWNSPEQIWSIIPKLSRPASPTLPTFSQTFPPNPSVPPKIIQKLGKKVFRLSIYQQVSMSSIFDDTRFSSNGGSNSISFERLCLTSTKHTWYMYIFVISYHYFVYYCKVQKILNKYILFFHFLFLFYCFYSSFFRRQNLKREKRVSWLKSNEYFEKKTKFTT